MAVPAVETAMAQPEVTEPLLAEAAARVVYDHEAIAKLAYLYAEQRGFRGGSPEADWLRAEAEFRGQKSMTASA